MYENPDPDIKYSNYSSVSKHDNHNDIVKVCDQCVRDIRTRGDDGKITNYKEFSQEGNKNNFMLFTNDDIRRIVFYKNLFPDSTKGSILAKFGSGINSFKSLINNNAGLIITLTNVIIGLAIVIYLMAIAR